jgi:signal peptidase I
MKTPVANFSKTHSVQCELASEVLHSSGTLRLGVSGWSMLPTLWPGDTLMIERVQSEGVVAGDIVLFARDRRFFVHRVTGKGRTDKALQTRGDSMPQFDPPISNRELLGRVVSIERNGKCIEPSREFKATDRSVAALVRHSNTAARVAVALHQLVQGS